MRALWLVLTAGLFLGALGGTATAELRIFVTNEKSNDVTVIDAATEKVVTRIAVGKRPKYERISFGATADEPGAVVEELRPRQAE